MFWLSSEQHPLFLSRPLGSSQGSLTKREELSFRTVLALPKASKAGLAWMIWSSRVPCEGSRDVTSFSAHLLDALVLVSGLGLDEQSVVPKGL